MPTDRLHDAARQLAPTHPNLDLALRRIYTEHRVRTSWCVVVGFGAGFTVVQIVALAARTTGISEALGLPDTFVAWFATQAAGVVGAFAGLFCRDRLLRRALTTPAGEPRCPHCRHSLIGLPHRDGCATCPECGSLHALAALGLAPGDLAPLNFPPVSASPARSAA